MLLSITLRNITHETCMCKNSVNVYMRVLACMYTNNVHVCIEVYMY